MDRAEVQTHRHALIEKLPALAMRVFALRGKSYNGSGFHWGHERSLGVLLRDLNNFDKRFEEEDIIVLEVIYEDLEARLDEIEAELALR